MTDRRHERALGALTFQDVPDAIRPTSALCLPLGAMEQHGPHLPLNTDAVIAEHLAGEIVARYGSEFDLWRLPLVPLGLSREHGWAAGTLTLNVQTFAALLRDMAASLVRACAARNLVIVNGHGGNRGILEALIYELQDEFGLNLCVIHPLALSGMEQECAFPDIHGGLVETSLMLVFAPHLVRTDRIPPSGGADRQAIQSLILDRGVSWPWSSGDPALAERGVTGEARRASAEFGQRVIERLLANVRPVLQQLRAREAR